MNRPGDNKFFTPLLSLSFCLTPYLSFSPPLFVHLFALSHLRLSVSFDSCNLFGTMCTVMDRKASMKAAQAPVHRLVFCLGPAGHKVIKKEDCSVGIVALWRQTEAPPECDLRPLGVGGWVVVWDRHYQ